MNDIQFNLQVLRNKFSRIMCIGVYAANACGCQIDGVDFVRRKKTLHLLRIGQVKLAMITQHQMTAAAPVQRTYQC